MEEKKLTGIPSIDYKINKERAKHYKYYTNRDWQDYTNYDLVLNTDILGVKGSAKLIEDFVKNKNNNI